MSGVLYYNKSPTSEGGSCLEDLPEQADKWIKEGKVLPLREWVKVDLPKNLGCLVHLRDRNVYSINIKDGRIEHTTIGEEPNDYIQLKECINGLRYHSCIWRGDLPVKIYLNDNIHLFELKECNSWCNLM